MSKTLDGTITSWNTAAERIVDLVITDLVMPVMGGRELTAELRRRYPNLSVVWMSGHPREVELCHADQTETLAFLQKPIPPRVLSETMARVFQRQRRRNQLH